jgi:hypothetical protein
LKKIISGINIEVLVFSGGLLFLALINPSQDHFSVCLFNLAGLDFCPGCGLGRSVSYLLHLNIHESLKTHILGIPAFIIILYRIVYLIKNSPVIVSSLNLNNFFVSKGTQQQ